MSTKNNDQTQDSGSIPVRVVAGGGGGGGPGQGTSPLGYQQITPLSTAQSLTVPAGATLAIVSAQGADAVWRDDGTPPTATVGMPLYAGQPVTFGGDLASVQFIQTQATTTLNVSYYK